MKTRSIKLKELDPKWHLIDVSGIRLGKVAQEIAKLLMGKDKVQTVDYLLTGDKVVVINSKNIDVHAKKLSQKMYYSHSEYIGSLKKKNLEEMLEKDATKVIKKAVWGMLPKTKKGKAMLSNLRIYNDDKIKETAQKPIKVNLNHLVKNG